MCKALVTKKQEMFALLAAGNDIPQLAMQTNI